MAVRIVHGDCRAAMRAMAADTFDSIVTDPPYHLTTAKKGGCGQASVDLSTPYGRARIGTGFMGMKWDGGDVAFDPATWREALRVLKPGGWLLAFGGTRTYHRLACAIEDAGFELRDSILNMHDGETVELPIRDVPWLMGWVYGCGFPKGTDKSKIPADWTGWNTALKPAWEPIVAARKPLIGALAENLLTHGAGALNIDACRVPVNDEAYARNCSGDRGHAGTRSRDELGATDVSAGGGTANEKGRWPANLVHDGSAAVVSLFPSEAGAASPVKGTEPSSASAGRVTGERDRVRGAFHADAGSAARFFYCAKASKADREEGCEHLPAKDWAKDAPGNAKAQVNTSSGRQREPVPSRNHHPTVKPTELMRYLLRLVTPRGGHSLDPFFGSGSTGKAGELESINVTGIEADWEHVVIAEARCRGVHANDLLCDVTVEKAA